MVSDKLFRSDLLYRLKTFVLNLPLLKDRKEDIRLIAKDQIVKSCKTHNLQPKDTSPKFIEMLEQYDWPGNVRELINAIETSVTASQFEQMLIHFHLPQKIRAQVTRSKISKINDHTPKRSIIEIDPSPLTHNEFIHQAEAMYIEFLYKETGGDIQKLLKRSCLSKTVLYRKLKKFNIR